MAGIGRVDGQLSDEQIAAVVSAESEAIQPQGKRILVIVPDGTRTAPLPHLFRLLRNELLGRAAAFDILIALGTHSPMSAERIDNHLGTTPDDWSGPLRNVHVFNHEWQNPDTFVTLGMITEEEIREISAGMLCQPVQVRINRLINDYDLLLVVGPVFPHEVVGFSGGNKYFFPGISGPEVINLSHWLGALITSYAIIGMPGITPVRRLIDSAAAMIATPKRCLAMVVAPGTIQLAGLYHGTPETAWAEASELSARLHVTYVDRPFRRVLSVMPPMYDDIWTAAKGMYKLEPIVEDGGELIIYAPHITEFSYTHGRVLAEVGYHVRDYFVKQWDRFKDYPGGVLAHSTHLRGLGSYDPQHGEQARIQVTLATGISQERCAAHCVGYANPTSIHPDEWANRESEDVLLVRKAGEMLYRLKR